MTLADIKEKYNLSIKEVSEKFGIPYRTVQNWSDGSRKAPEYVLNMMDIILKNNLL